MKNYTKKLRLSEMTDLFCGFNTDMNYILLYTVWAMAFFESCNVWTGWINNSETKQKKNVNQNV